MSKTELIQSLENYQPFDDAEAASQQQILEFLKKSDNCFDRSNLEGHITGSAWVLSPDHKKVLLTHHAKLKQWLQLGGHCDGSSDVLDAAIREAQEESGIEEVAPLQTDIFDVDAHRIPASLKKNEPEHWHYDIIYVLKADNENHAISDESLDLAWIPLEKVTECNTEPRMQRLVKKWRKMGK